MLFSTLKLEAALSLNSNRYSTSSVHKTLFLLVVICIKGGNYFVEMRDNRVNNSL